MIQGVDVSREDYVNLKVFVKMPTVDANTAIYMAEYVGSSIIVPSPDAGKRLFATVKFEVGDNLRRLGLQSDEYVVVTILTNSDAGPVTIRGMEMEYQSTICSS